MSGHTTQFAPAFKLNINGTEIPGALRTCITSVRLQSGMEGADRLEFSVFNEQLRWLDHDLLKLQNEIQLRMGYVDSGLIPLFSGLLSGVEASFPSSGTPLMQITAQDRIADMQKGEKSRWFEKNGDGVNEALPRSTVVGRMLAAHGLKPRYDPVGELEKLSGAIAGVLSENSSTSDPSVPQRGVERQIKSPDHTMLKKIAGESGYDIFLDHSGDGKTLVFFTPAKHLAAAVELKYGRSLIEFNPRESDSRQIREVSANVWRSDQKQTIAVVLGWDQKLQQLRLTMSPGQTKPESDKTTLVIDQPLTVGTAPRRLVSELIPILNKRLTGSGSAVGDPRIRPGAVIDIAGVGQQFGGLYRVTACTHSIDGGGYRTQFEVRKEVWFQVPRSGRSAIRVALPLPDKRVVPR